MNNRRRCENCKWYDESTDVHDEGRCRAAIPSAGDDGYALWPVVLSCDWCSEFDEYWEPGQLGKTEKK
jgi:hypothetical protein